MATVNAVASLLPAYSLYRTTSDLHTSFLQLSTSVASADLRERASAFSPTARRPTLRGLYRITTTSISSSCCSDCLYCDGFCSAIGQIRAQLTEAADEPKSLCPKSSLQIATSSSPWITAVRWPQSNSPFRIVTAGSARTSPNHTRLREAERTASG